MPSSPTPHHLPDANVDRGRLSLKLHERTPMKKAFTLIELLAAKKTVDLWNLKQNMTAT